MRKYYISREGNKSRLARLQDEVAAAGAASAATADVAGIDRSMKEVRISDARGTCIDILEDDRS